MSEFKNLRIGFIGGGNMAQAIVKGLLGAGHEALSLSVSEPDATQRERLGTLFSGINVAADNQAVADQSDILILAVKPQVMADVAKLLSIREESLLISIAAGITLRSLQGWFGSSLAMVRIMPNQPADAIYTALHRTH